MGKITNQTSTTKIVLGAGILLAGSVVGAVAYKKTKYKSTKYVLNIAKKAIPSESLVITSWIFEEMDEIILEDVTQKVYNGGFLVTIEEKELVYHFKSLATTGKLLEFFQEKKEEQHDLS